MITLENDNLHFSFADVHEDAQCQINFQRTLRIPDDGRTYPLPAGLGDFPLKHIEDYANSVPANWASRGGVILPMYQSEAMWICFQGTYPMAIKIAAGKVNAVTGKDWSNELNSSPQDYMVIPEQPWLDGYCVRKGLIRQFVAMPLGKGYSAEEQITGKAEFGGIQAIVYPMKASAYEALKDIEIVEVAYSQEMEQNSAMGLGAGGLMKQDIHIDEYGLDVWDKEHASRCFIHLINSEAYLEITGENPPYPPITQTEYQQNGVPWFDYYGDQKALQGAEPLSALKTVSEVTEQKGEKLWDNDSMNVSTVKTLKAHNTVSEGEF